MIDRKKLIELIPWYMNGTLTGEEFDEVKDFVSSDPEGKAIMAEWIRVRQLLQPDDSSSPSVGIEARLFDRIRSQSIEQLGIFHPYALGLSLVILVFLWTIFQPGVTLKWDVVGTHVTSCRIYRGEVGEVMYTVLDEIPVDDSTVRYTYIDLFASPFKEYVYFVEGISGSVGVVTSPIAASPAFLALPGQVALLCASLFIGYGIILIIRYRKLLLIGNIQLSAV